MIILIILTRGENVSKKRFNIIKIVYYLSILLHLILVIYGCLSAVAPLIIYMYPFYVIIFGTIPIAVNLFLYSEYKDKVKNLDQEKDTNES